MELKNKNNFNYEQWLDYYNNELNVYNKHLKELWKRINEKNLSIPQRSKLYSDKTYIDYKVLTNIKYVRKYKNIQRVLNAGGNITSITDQFGIQHNDIADFRNISITKQDFSKDNLIDLQPPNFIPFIHEKLFEYSGGSMDCMKIADDSFLLAVNGHKEKDPFNMDDFLSAGYCIINLDQLVLTAHYYQQKQTQIYKTRAAEKTQKEKQRWFKIPEDKRERFFMQPNFYHSLPKAIQKKITQQKYESLTWQEREKVHLPVKTFRAEKLKSNLDSKHMRTSFHGMYERFIDKTAQRTNKDRTPIAINAKAIGSYANSIVFSKWSEFREMLDWKIKDIRVQNEFDNETRKKALETSFGNKNTSNILLNDYGILVKRQNGDKIKFNESMYIKEAWYDVQSCLGTLVDKAKDYELKISYTGNTRVYASKALGVFYDKYKAIAVSNKFGEGSFRSIMAHEIAHWIDRLKGREIGKRFASNNFDSTAGKLAINFKKNLNFKTDSIYLNCTHECFARSIEQYFVMESKSMVMEKVKEKICKDPNFVSLHKYDTLIKPLVKQLKEEYSLTIDPLFEKKHQDFEKNYLDNYNKNNKVQINKKQKEQVAYGFDSKNVSQLKLF